MADGLAHWVLVVGTHPRVSACLFEDGSMVSDLCVHVRVMVVVQVFIHVSLGSFWLSVPELWAGCFMVFLCPGCGLELFAVSMLVDMLGCPVCGVILAVLFRGGVVRLSYSLVAFWLRVLPFPSFRGGVVRCSGFSGPCSP